MRGRHRAALGAVVVAFAAGAWGAAPAQAGDVRFVEEHFCGRSCDTLRTLQFTSSGAPAKVNVDLDQVLATVQEPALTTAGPGCLALNVPLLVRRSLLVTCTGILQDPLFLLDDYRLRILNARLVGTGGTDDFAIAVGPRTDPARRLIFNGATGFGHDRVVSGADHTELQLGEGNDAFASTGSWPQYAAHGTFVYGGAGDDQLHGGTLRDALRGDDGNDVLVGGPARDSLMGGLGDDLIEARDGERDEVLCGPGTDTALVDPEDQAGADCETVQTS